MILDFLFLLINSHMLYHRKNNFKSYLLRLMKRTKGIWQEHLTCLNRSHNVGFFWSQDQEWASSTLLTAIVYCKQSLIMFQFQVITLEKLKLTYFAFTSSHAGVTRAGFNLWSWTTRKLWGGGGGGGISKQAFHRQHKTVIPKGRGREQVGSPQLLWISACHF